MKLSTSPIFQAVSPSEGWTKGGESVIIIGDNFFDVKFLLNLNFQKFTRMITGPASYLRNNACLE